MNARSRLSPLLCILSLAAGCAHLDDPFGAYTGIKHPYEWWDGNFRIESDAIVAVAVLDRRSYVLSGEKPLNFTGTVIDGFGDRFYTVTRSSYPLARDFGESIAQALRAGGTETIRVDIQPTYGRRAAKKRLLSEEADRFVLVNLWEWSSNTFWNTELFYSVEMEIYNRSGKVLASKELQGTDVKFINAFSPGGRSIKVVSELYPKKLKELFLDPKVVDSLTLSD
ncbi:MAG: hypothetical protein GWP69_17125 [Gammaproteobacteria bacterium]|jgi:hypothetical protein|nr:hypothetical protein [Gammaproteobacteria bacterium]